jgi:hypothetical protein
VEYRRKEEVGRILFTRGMAGGLQDRNEAACWIQWNAAIRVVFNTVNPVRYDHRERNHQQWGAP